MNTFIQRQIYMLLAAGNFVAHQPHNAMLPTTVVEPFERAVPIKRGDKVLHTLSDREFLCMDNKQQRWMNMNPYYVLLPPK